VLADLAQGGLGDLVDGVGRVLDRDQRGDRVGDPVVGDRGDVDRDVVAGDDPWDWIGMVTIRSDTRRSTSTSGTISRRPGARTPLTRPTRNSTPRSYCLTIRTDNASTTTTTTATTTLIPLLPSCRVRSARGNQPPCSG
jgi:hypothetical protein